MNCNRRRKPQAKNAPNNTIVTKGLQLTGMNKRNNNLPDWQCPEDLPSDLNLYSSSINHDRNPTTSRDASNVNHKKSASVNVGTSGNAPTSLSNLAQLSGITLLPMSKQCHVSSNKSKNQHVFSALALKQSKTSNNLIRPDNDYTNQQPLMTQTIATTGLRQNPSDRINGTLDIVVGDRHRRTLAHDLSTISSVRMLNQTSTTHSSSQRSNGVTSNIQHLTFPSQLDIKPTFLNKNINNGQLRTNRAHNQVNSNHFNMQPSISLNNNVELIPVTKPYPINSSSVNNDSLNVSYNKGQGSHSTKLSGTDFGHQPNLDLTSEGILQIMAVLSNPALTITPISELDQAHMQREHFDIDDSIGEATITAVTMNNEYVHPDNVNYTSTGYGNLNTNVHRNSNRIPRSAANLQMVYSDNTTDIPSDNYHEAVNHFELNSQMHECAVAHPGQAQSWIRYDQTDVAIQSSDSSVMEMSIDDFYETIQAKTYDALTKSVRNLLMSQNIDSSATPTVSVQILKQLADEARGSENTNRSSITPNIVSSGPDIFIGAPKRLDFDLAAKIPEVSEIVYVDVSSLSLKTPKPQLATSKKRLFVPPNDYQGKKRRLNDGEIIWPKIIVEKVDSGNEIYLSDRHQMISSLRLDEARRIPHSDQVSSNNRPNLSREPKSRIGLMADYIKSIEGKILERGCTVEDMDKDEIATLWFYLPEESSMIINKVNFIDVNIPAEDDTTDEKKAFMQSIGLVTRYDRQKMSLNFCEKRLRNYSALAFESRTSTSEDTHRFVKMIEQTGGSDIQLRTDTNIKRSELPVIEGLNRNTSKVKMSYMSVLGLDKRSKRTTLYKVGKTQDNASSGQDNRQNKLESQQPRLKQQNNQPNDLNNRNKVSTTEVKQNTRAAEPKINQENVSDIIPILFGLESISRGPLSTIALSCREAMNKPSKQDYMKSLGLTSS